MKLKLIIGPKARRENDRTKADNADGAGLMLTRHRANVLNVGLIDGSNEAVLSAIEHAEDVVDEQFDEPIWFPFPRRKK